MGSKVVVKISKCVLCKNQSGWVGCFLVDLTEVYSVGLLSGWVEKAVQFARFAKIVGFGSMHRVISA